ncbi:transporter substrate-binding domain-containing protein [Pararhizobium mangrovi]|uniref:Transporter substrate-binding domain-containing protein n=1 Tax=Pararhizobium mangrovi TaxID=2590452 RepID=A0A506U697_9HYPH|nr:transporter substrate-binding domain-containing protein [Pararhizobium mangrovi]TPW29912.1 transporter substrate-binding domain-containing protein [Pararhizobium mangrovi]
MKSLLTKIALAAFAIALPLGASAHAAETVKVGISAEPYPPFSQPDASGNWSGWEIDIMHAVCKQADLDCKITPVSWDGIIPALKSGKIDMIFNSMSITADRKKEIDFSEKYYQTPAIVVGQKSEDFKPTKDGMDGKYLGVQVSTIHETYARKHFPGASLKVYQQQDEANQDLVSGRIDATLADALALQPFLDSDQGKACCEMKGKVDPDADVLGTGIGAGFRKGDDDLKKKVNAAIDAIRQNGTYKKISDKYFDFDIYGG